MKALASHESVNAVMTETRDDWPKFAQATLAAGMGSVLSSPLSVPERLLGALNIYAADSAHFSRADQKTAGLLAQQASVLLANAVAFAGASALNEQLHEALETRDLIGQAKGILMEREGCDSDHAFDILRRASQRSNRKLRDVASELIQSAQSRPRGT